MAEKKTISVIVPVYNCERYIEQCVNSILAQNDSVHEVILVDDGSTDQSGEICDEISERKSKVKTVHQGNRGVSSARNTGMELAEGEFLSFVDADDQLPPDALERLMAGTVMPAQLYIGNCLKTGNGCEPDLMYGSLQQYSAASLADAMMCKPKTRLLMSGVWGKLFVSEIIRDHKLTFDTKLQNGEDGLFIAKYLKYTDRIVNMMEYPPVYYLYRYREEERISAVTAAYPDFFQFHMTHSRILYEIVCQNEKQDCSGFLNKFMDELIIHLVRAFAYRSFFTEVSLHEKLKQIVSDDLVKRAIRKYKREYSSYSIAVPAAIRLKSVYLLEKALDYRADLYLKSKQRTAFVKSIYRTGEVCEKAGENIG